jgi:glycogen operon protein
MNVDLDLKDVVWIDANGGEMSTETWEDDQTLCFAMLIDGRAQATGIKRRSDDSTLLIVLNAYHDLVKFALPECYEASGWNRLMDTTDPKSPERQYEIGEIYDVTGRSALLFERIAAKGT